MASDKEFWDIINDILDVPHLSIYTTANGWQGFATAGTTERDRLAGVAGEAESEPGVGLPELAGRLRNTADWAEGASSVAQRISEQLRQAGQAAARAIERALELAMEYKAAQVDLAPDAISPSMVSAAMHAEEERERLLAEARALLNELEREFTRVTGGQPPAAPEGSAAQAADQSAASAQDRFGPPPPGSPDDADDPHGDNMIEGTPPSSIVQRHGGQSDLVPGGELDAQSQAYQTSDQSQAYQTPGLPIQDSDLSVLGPESGEFSGWVQSPNTGYWVDPATGREFDPVTSRWIDPVTGLPFGEATEYATRLSGLGNGPGAMATGIGLTGLGAGGVAIGGTAGLAGLYGGVLPPSVAHQGPAQQQVLQEAQRNMQRRAAVATRFAMREAAQGGRPFMPPPPAMAGRSGSEERGRAGRGTDLTEDPEVWSARRTAPSGVLGA